MKTQICFSTRYLTSQSQLSSVFAAEMSRAGSCQVEAIGPGYAATPSSPTCCQCGMDVGYRQWRRKVGFYTKFGTRQLPPLSLRHMLSLVQPETSQDSCRCVNGPGDDTGSGWRQASSWEARSWAGDESRSASASASSLSVMPH